jgi:hypothetical protein
MAQSTSYLFEARKTLNLKARETVNPDEADLVCVLKVGRLVGRAKVMIPARSVRVEKNALGLELMRFIRISFRRKTHSDAGSTDGGQDNSFAIYANEQKYGFQDLCRKKSAGIK